MNLQEAGQLLRAKGIEVDPTDPRDVIQIGLDMGHIGLKHRLTELTGSYDRADIAAMRRGGLVVEAVGFGQAVYEAVFIDQITQI
ncbi:MAG: hypothetical protein JWO47_735 [Candidatus Saccharibacteria bacterium]|nr:hypothetical protein [Candidatus Saccharibacteria bacterium]